MGTLYLLVKSIRSFYRPGPDSRWLTLILLSINQIQLLPATAQETTKITYSVEPDTVAKQRFIDRYENVFMTRVPTRHMFKIGLSQYYQAMNFPLIDDKVFNNTSLHLGYEFKFLPAFSIAASGHFPYYGPDLPLKKVLQYTVMDAQLRWFMDMRKRIRSGRAANNFSGNYAALFYNMAGTSNNSPSIGLKFGFQRRFLNSGFMDFALALQQQTPWFHYGALNNWSISSQATFGFAFGDWKRSDTGPLCDVLLCNEFIKAQWKIRLPEISLGNNLNRIRLGIAYERKFTGSPLSLNVQFDLGLNSGSDFIENRQFIESIYIGKYIESASKEVFPSVSVQPRYYLLHKKQQLRGKGGNGFSGIYTGLHSEYSYYSGHHTLYTYQGTGDPLN